MSIDGQVHWHEGLFLQPHHLQAMQQSVRSAFTFERQLAWTYPYGLIEARLSADELENMLVRFERLTAIMPSGTHVEVPGNADLPPLDIKQVFEASSTPFSISLGVPLWYPERSNTLDRGDGEDWRVKRLYRIAEVERPDENTGDNPQPVLVRRLNARLLLEDDDQTDLEVLPLLRIVPATGDEVGLPRQDPRYIPPCLVVGGSPTLREMLRDLANQVEASRNELASRITQGGFSIETMRGMQFEQMLRLRTLNRFGGRLSHLGQSPSISPFVMYLELRDLLGELAALQPDRDQYDVPDYNHDRPAEGFAELARRIRLLIHGAVAPSFMKVSFVKDRHMLAADVSDEQITRPNEYFLAIRTKMDPSSLAKLVEDADKFKFMARSMVDRNIWGVRLAEERHPPLELPAETGLHYFRLMRGESGRMWDRIKEEQRIAVRWLDVESSDFEVTLFMTVPDDQG